MNRYKVATAIWRRECVATPDIWQKEFDATSDDNYQKAWEILASWCTQEEGPRTVEGHIYLLTGSKAPRWDYLATVYVHINANGKVVA